MARLDEQFSRLDAGVAALRRAQANLKRYRASVLKAACEGRLVPTEAELARQEGRTYETGEQLLTRILEERRTSWNGKGRYKAPPPPDTTNLPELPDGWTYVGIDAILATDSVGMKTGPFGSLLKKHEHRITGVPVLGIENIGKNGTFVSGSKIHVDHAKARELSGYDIVGGDILVSRSGTVGELCTVPPLAGSALFSTNLMRIRVCQKACSSAFFCFLFDGSPLVLRQVENLCKGSTRTFLNQHILRSVLFPLPPIAEQARIVAEVERHLSVVDCLEDVLTADLKRAVRHRQAMLQQTFQQRHERPATTA